MRHTRPRTRRDPGACAPGWLGALVVVAAIALQGLLGSVHAASHHAGDTSPAPGADGVVCGHDAGGDRDHSDHPSPPGHHDPGCDVCKLLSMARPGVSPGEAPCIGVPRLVDDARAPVRVPAPRGAVVRGSIGARAPPVL